MSRLAFLLCCLAAPAAVLADDPLRSTTRIIACSDTRHLVPAHCFAVSPDQRWETISRTGGRLLLRRVPAVAGEPPLFFRPADMVAVTPPEEEAAGVPTAGSTTVDRRSPPSLSWIVPILVLIAIGTLSGIPGRSIITAWKRRQRRVKAIRLALAEISVQQRRLQIKRFQLVSTDDYGTVDLRKWQQEKRYFCTTRLVPLLSAAGLDDQWAAIAEEIDVRIDTAASQAVADSAPAPRFVSDPQRFDPRMDPIDYERHCAMLLWMSGWDAQLTAASGDQGADVLARRDGKLLVVQCKLYRSAVGNAAVQQVSAARLHQQANYAAVVSNARFTPQARQLARTNGVYLLHHEELRAFQPA